MASSTPSAKSAHCNTPASVAVNLSQAQQLADSSSDSEEHSQGGVAKGAAVLTSIWPAFKVRTCVLREAGTWVMHHRIMRVYCGTCRRGGAQGGG